MVIRLHELNNAGVPVVEKLLCTPESPEGVDVSRLGAFRVSGRLVLKVKIPRRLGIVRTYLRIRGDDSLSYEELELGFCGSYGGLDTYSVEISLRELCRGGEDGLFFYEFLFFRGGEVFWSNTPNN